MPSKISKIKVFSGGLTADKRGRVSFVNNFHFKGVKRFYQIQNSPSSPVRAFHGHMKEAKYFYVAKGSILLAAVKLDNPKSPNKNAPVYKKILSHKNPTIAAVPAGYANGFKALEKNTTVIIFSTATLTQSLKDDYRFPANYWGKRVWNSFPISRKTFD